MTMTKAEREEIYWQLAAERSREYYAANKDKMAAYQREYYKARKAAKLEQLT